jgi:ribose-phosphate pyrophosphokinase
VAGADRVVTLDLHAPQIQGFFRIPVDDLYALPVLCAAIVRQQLPDLVVVSPDTGFVKQARKYASFLCASLAIADKQCQAHDERAEVRAVVARSTARDR